MENEKRYARIGEQKAETSEMKNPASSQFQMKIRGKNEKRQV